METFKKKMKTSIQLLIGSAIGFLLLVILGFSLYRMDYQNTVNDKDIGALTLDPFSELHIHENWDVVLKQGNIYKIEFPNQDEAKVKNLVFQNEDELTINTNETNTPSKIKIEITTLGIKKLRIRKNSQIDVNAFKTDTIGIELEKGAVFNGDQNNFNHVTFSVLESY